MKTLILLFLSLILFTEGKIFAGIINTKHNLSVSGDINNTVKASSETEICVFCHLPHYAQAVGAPLWNRSMPTSEYEMYNSNYLKRTGYPVPTELGNAPDKPGTVSRQCLSCHDGTIAIGSVSKLRRDFNVTISMGGVETDGSMINTSSAFIGTDLRNHHPVAISYGETMTFDINESNRTNELKASPDSPIVLRSYGGAEHVGKTYVECISCHDPHKENEKFLRVNIGTHAQNIAGTCLSCHIKDNFTGSTHDVMTAEYTDVTLNNKFSGGANTKVSDMKCVNCHTPHNSGSSYLTRQVQEQTCFQGASDTVSTAPCHGTNGADGGKDIETVMSRQYGHGFTLTDTNNNAHTNLDYVYGAGVPQFPTGTKGVAWADSQHVECVDCHNQHQVRAITRTASASWYPSINNGTNLIGTGANSGPLTGASGVKPTIWPTTMWTQPTTFTTLETATYEYEVCFKCHSYWGLGADGENFDSMSGSPAHSEYVTFSDANLQFTDVAWEFNVNNRSAHPVVMKSTGRAGNSGTSPDSLEAETMLAPWKNVGNQTMYCSDCHGADNELSEVDPKGPHGSNYKFMLKGVGNFWPTDDSSQDVTHAASNPLTIGDGNGKHYQVSQSGGTASRPGLFCQNCHDIDQTNSDKQDAPHNVKNEMAGLYCVRCHVAIPHGSPLSRLFGYNTFPAPYNYNGNMLIGTGFNKSSNYQDSHFAAGTINAPPESGDPSGNCNNKHPNSISGESAPAGWQ